jgi:hypothetical protein
MTGKAPKRPRDANQLARFVVEQATKSDKVDPPPEKIKNPAAVSLGSLGGKKGGAARAESLSPHRRSEIAKRAAQKRWEKIKGLPDKSD